MNSVANYPAEGGAALTNSALLIHPEMLAQSSLQHLLEQCFGQIRF